MPSILDIFNSDAYSTVNLTRGIESLPMKPGRLGASGLFQVEGVTTHTVALEFKKGKLALIPTKVRKSGATTMLPPEKAKVRPFIIPWLPYDDALYASDVQGVREFGTSDRVAAINKILQGKLVRLRDHHEVTHEYHRIGAIQGHIKDADGIATIFNLFTEFSITEKVIEFDLDVTTTDVKAKCNEVIDWIQGKLGASTSTGVTAQVGLGFWNALISHPNVVAAFEVFQEGRFLRERQEEKGVQRFEFCGITFERYVGTVGDVDFIPTGVARFYPTGVQDLFFEHYGPPDTVDGANTIGKPFYASQERMKHGRGIEIATESNPAVLCSDPELLVKGNQ